MSDVDLGAVARTVRERFPAWAGLPLVDLPGAGTVHHLVRIGTVAALRIPKDHGPEVAERLAVEADAAAAFAAACPVRAPLPLGLGDASSPLGRPWSAQTWIEGATATPTSVAASDAFVDDLVGLIRVLRGVATGGRTFTGSGRGGDLRDHDAWMAECLRASEGLVDVRRIAALWDRLHELPRDAPDVMTHGDLIPQNLLVRDGRLVGVLDGGGFGPADPALDLVAGWHLLDAERRRRMRDGLGSADLEWARGAAWALEQAMGLVWYYRTSMPGMSELGSVTIERLLAAAIP